MLEQNYLEIIKAELDTRAHDDEFLAANLKKDNKSWEECGEYIYNEIVKIRGTQKVVALQDDLVYGMAMHYWEDDKIIVSKPVKSNTPTSAKPAPTEKETKAKKEAEKKAQAEKLQGDLFATSDEPEPKPEADGSCDNDDLSEVDEILNE